MRNISNNHITDEKIKKSIAILEIPLKNELTAVRQYTFNAQLFKSWGFSKLAESQREEAREESEHVDMLADRIFSLGGFPDYGSGDKILLGEDLKDILEHDLKLETKVVADLKQFVKALEELGDFVSRELLIKILNDEENHIIHIKRDLSLIETLGMEGFLGNQI